MTEGPPLTRPSLRAAAVLFVGYWVLCLGLGYATLNRYDPRQIGNSDSRVYYQMVLGQEVDAPAAYRAAAEGGPNEHLEPLIAQFAASQRGRPPREPSLDEETRAQLRAMGYLPAVK